jgi:large subunit ribosomal protein L23
MAALFGKKEDKNPKKSEKENVLNMAKDPADKTDADKTDKDSKSGAKNKTATEILKENTGDAYRILVRPLVSEKSYKSTTAGKYVFVVHKQANKIQVRNAVEKVYDVKVIRVNILNNPGKARVFGRAKGRTSDWKKAIVTLKKGQIIGEAQS